MMGWTIFSVAEWLKANQTASMLGCCLPVEMEAIYVKRFYPTSEGTIIVIKKKATQGAKSIGRTVVRESTGALSRKWLTDRVRPGLRILFVGINPGLRSAATGHHFAGHSNRFWKLLFESKLTPESLTFQDDWRLPDWGLGLTNIIRRPSAGVDVLKPREYMVGRKRLVATVKRYRPHIVALLGVTIYRMLFPDYRTGRISLGLQGETLAGRPVFVLANPSGRNAHYSYRTMLMAFRTLKCLG